MLRCIALMSSRARPVNQLLKLKLKRLELSFAEKMSYWLEHLSNKNNNVPFSIPIDIVDTVIIGCGVSGASAAYHLAKHNPAKSIIVLERGEISSGATGCNGGFICPGTSEKFSSSVERYGLAATQEMYDYTVKCTEMVKSFVKASNEDCELRFHGCVQLALSVAELDGLRTSYEQLVSFGQDVEWWDQRTCRERTRSESYLGGLYKPQAGNIWAAKLVHAIVTEAKKIGVQVVSHCPVLGVDEADEVDGTLRVRTAQGVVRVKTVVYATNAWARELLPELQELIIPVRNQLIMTTPMQPLWDFSLSCNTGYEYFMQRPDGRILLGGMRNLAPGMEVNCADPVALHAEVSAALRAYLPKHFPGRLRPLNTTAAVTNNNNNTAVMGQEGPEGEDTRVQTPTVFDPSEARSEVALGVPIESEWIGIMGFTPDRNPLVGPLAHRPGQYILAGYTGHGMPVAFLAGKNIAEMISGVASDVPVPQAYAPSRYNL